MPLGVIPITCLEFLEKKRKKGKPKKKKSGQNGLLRRSAGNPRCSIALHRNVGCPHCGKAEVPKWHPSGTP